MRPPLQALIFDSQYDSYRGVIVYLRVMNGVLRPGMDIRMMATGAEYKIVEVGYLHPNGMIPADGARRRRGRLSHRLHQERGRHPRRRHRHRRGATPAAEPLPGYKAVQPMVFSGIYPADGSKYGDLRDALEKLKLNDASMSYDAGNLHRPGLRLPLRLSGPAAHGDHHGAPASASINLDLITTAPNVVYRDHEDQRRGPSRSTPR